ncbi:heterokaryon incompatibility protein-domain-containing protein [Hypoxylon cercidicola]|nr:heterokaryon incompatibility protein-domain-containing protein [Hypoxylon cercidicola]
MIFCTNLQYHELGIDVNETWGFEAENDHFPPSVDLSQVAFHATEDMATSQDCLICQTLVGGLRMHNDETNASIALCRLCPDEELARDIESCQGSWTGKLLLLFCAAYPQGSSGKSHTPEPYLLEVELSYSSGLRGFEDIKMWDRRLVNTMNIKKQLLHCQEHHEMCKKSVFPKLLPSGFRVIDVSTRSIAEPQTQEGHVDFVALSYQWATATADEDRNIMLLRDDTERLQAPGSLSVDRLPEVIQDAVQFCQDIGYRYLWVDRLCIYQDKDDQDGSKQAQIDGMGAIYWLAVLTLVACADGVGVGLPGVSGRPRLNNLKNQGWQFLRTTDYNISSEDFIYFQEPSDIEFIDTSSWSTRGWTFQERMISRRLLFFGHSHALLNCFYYNECEESFDKPRVLFEGEDIYGSSFGADVRMLNKEKDTERDPLMLYERVVLSYTSRSLTWASDILKAFSGVNEFFVENLQTKSLFGLPAKYLFHSLLWIRAGTPTSEGIPEGIPSWSWATRFGCASYGLWSYDELGNLVRFWYSDNGTVEEVVEATCWFDESNVTVRDDLSLDVERKRFQENTQRCGTEHELSDPGVWETCPHDPLEAIGRRQVAEEFRALAVNIPGCLVFNTTEAFLRVRLNETATSEIPGFPSSIYEESAAARAYERPQPKVLDIVDDDGIRIGHTLAEVFPRDHKLSLTDGQYLRCHVVVLGASNMRQPTYAPRITYNDNVLNQGVAWGLFVMLVDRNGYLSSRLGIGFVHPLLWARAKPEWKTVFLI